MQESHRCIPLQSSVDLSLAVLAVGELSLRRAGTGFTVDLKGNLISFVRHEIEKRGLQYCGEFALV
jgi:hypothetical protein